MFDKVTNAYDHLNTKELRDLPDVVIPNCGECGKRHVLKWVNADEGDMFGGHYEHGHCVARGKSHERTIIGIRNVPRKLLWHAYWYAKQLKNSPKIIASIGG